MVVTIDSGPVEAERILRHVPRERWRELMLARRRFCEIKLSYDCRCLVQFINDAETMFAELGFGSADDLIRNGYGLEPAEIAVAVEWLRLNPPTEPIGLEKVKALSLAQDLAADPTVTALARHGEIGRGRDRVDIVNSIEGGNSATYLVRRLKRDHPEIADALARGEYASARAAGIAAGIVKVKSRVEKTQAMVEKMTTSERRAFKRWFLETYS